MAGLAGNGWKFLDIAGNGWNGLNGWTELEMAGMPRNA